MILPKIAETRPELFIFSPPPKDNDIAEFERTMVVSVPESLRILWRHWGTGCLFESEDFLSPAHDKYTGESAYSVNREFRERGMQRNLIAFHRGTGGLTCTDESGTVFQLDDDDLSVRETFESIDEWLNGFLMTEYGPRYGFGPK